MTFFQGFVMGLATGACVLVIALGRHLQGGDR